MVQCKDCRFFQPLEKRPVGQCRREPPKLMLVPSGPSISAGPNQMSMSAPPDMFPPVTPDGWCGMGEANEGEKWRG
jgi:hypothetical protein